MSCEGLAVSVSTPWWTPLAAKTRMVDTFDTSTYTHGRIPSWISQLLGASKTVSNVATARRDRSKGVDHRRRARWWACDRMNVRKGWGWGRMLHGHRCNTGRPTARSGSSPRRRASAHLTTSAYVCAACPCSRYSTQPPRRGLASRRICDRCLASASGGPRIPTDAAPRTCVVSTGRACSRPSSRRRKYAHTLAHLHALW